MTPTTMAILTFLSFVLPIPILAWLGPVPELSRAGTNRVRRSFRRWSRHQKQGSTRTDVGTMTGVGLLDILSHRLCCSASSA